MIGGRKTVASCRLLVFSGDAAKRARDTDMGNPQKMKEDMNCFETGNRPLATDN
jgi:hypothetical protein